MSIADFLPDSPLRLGFVKNAEAIIGMPWTPFSFAGVARRSMYREAAWNAAAHNAAAANARRRAMLLLRMLLLRVPRPQTPPLLRLPQPTLLPPRELPDLPYP